MNVSAASILGGRHLYLVTTKNLQAQLSRDPFGLAEIRGHSDYDCARNSRLGSSNRYESDFECRVPDDECGYKQDVLTCNLSTGVQTNYAHWIALAKSDNGDRLGTFDTLICDEAHLVCDTLVNQLAVPIVPSVLHRYLGIDQHPKLDSPVSEWLDFSREVCRIADEYIDMELSQPPESRNTRALRVLSRIYSEFARAVESMPVEPWVVKPDDDNNSTLCSLVPVHPSRFAERYLFRGIKNVILCSATLMPEMVTYLGINPDHCARFEMGSPFLPARRPVIWFRGNPRIRVDQRMTRGMWQVIVRRCDAIIAKHSTHRGIIHTRSYDRAESFLRETRTPREQLITHDRGRGALNYALAKLLDSDPPRAIISPSLQEGYDFADDRARYQIAFKVPFLDLRDPLTAARKKSNPEYVNACAAVTFQQLVGRVCRNPQDYGATFMMDDHWAWFQYAVDWPQDFRASFQVCDEATEPLKF